MKRGSKTTTHKPTTARKNMITASLIDQIEANLESTGSSNWVLPSKRARKKAASSNANTRRTIELIQEKIAFKRDFGIELEA